MKHHVCLREESTANYEPIIRQYGCGIGCFWLRFQDGLWWGQHLGLNRLQDEDTAAR